MLCKLGRPALEDVLTTTDFRRGVLAPAQQTTSTSLSSPSLGTRRPRRRVVVAAAKGAPSASVSSSKESSAWLATGRPASLPPVAANELPVVLRVLPWGAAGEPVACQGRAAELPSLAAAR
jgi:hypothetical protein